jgi:hypothetical protein
MAALTGRLATFDLGYRALAVARVAVGEAVSELAGALGVDPGIVAEKTDDRGFLLDVGAILRDCAKRRSVETVSIGGRAVAIDFAAIAREAQQ